ncbi:LON peptidase substrate-binding domain-containing protein [Roseateles koreensis]|uniref:LON peptidase substrate-binding domain-containing protein n=1 Tax=Roseateles koreensis TaxID=2987526 RepID=A0ABT5KU57_9BURK|nr:LON peptidase substrate-binding domain-containing protein [Roseateles koreensis]MDC8785888.1 LON peptidase substrate-binding domain-containing protein [Roseateles koreensis]
MTTQTVPIFPLNTVLFPGGYLPLRVFEPRYLDMISRVHKAGQAFGVVLLIEGGEIRQRDEHAGDGSGFVRERFHEVGTLAHIDFLAQQGAGLLQVRCHGGARFQLKNRQCLPHGLWMGEIELLAPDATVPVPGDLAPAAVLLQTLLHSLEQGAAAADMPFQPPYQWSDSGWLANRWAEMLPLTGDERQRLMQLDNPLLRLELVADQLDRLGQPPGR